jgi:hypothetical protein
MCQVHGNKSGTRAVAVLKRIWAGWQRIGQFIGDFIARVVLSLFYFTLFVPFGIGVRLFGDPLDLKARARRSLWVDRPARDLALDDARRQF